MSISAWGKNHGSHHKKTNATLARKLRFLMAGSTWSHTGSRMAGQRMSASSTASNSCNPLAWAHLYIQDPEAADDLLAVKELWMQELNMCSTSTW